MFCNGLFGSCKNDDNIALFVDGPNVITRKSNFDLRAVIKETSKSGNVKVAKVFLDQYASDKLIEAMTNQGYDPRICISDIDVALAIGVMEQVFNPCIGKIAIMTTNPELLPVFNKIKEHGKKAILVGANDTLNVDLKKAADALILVKHKNWRA